MKNKFIAIPKARFAANQDDMAANDEIEKLRQKLINNEEVVVTPDGTVKSEEDLDKKETRLKPPPNIVG